MFSSTPVTVDGKNGNMEDATNNDFQNYPTGGSRNSVSIYNHTAGGTYSQLLNGGNNSQVGLAKSYKVYPGDKVKIEAYAKYANLTSNSSNVSAFASALLNAFLLPAPVGGEIGTASTALNDWGSIVAAGGDGQSNAAPHVSVNIIIFDKNFNFLDAAYEQIDAGAEQVGVSPVISHDYLTKEYTVKEEGYVFMYIANENATQVDAYFDDVSMTYTPTNVVQYNDYYPFGLQTSTSWTRDNNNNNFLYNQGGELNVTTGLYDLAYRNYDPAVGRFQQVDPLAAQYHSYSTYNYALNNPVMMNDPSGAKADDPWGTMTGVDKTLGRLQAWSDFMDSFNPFYSGSHGGGGGSGYGQWYRYSQYYAEAQSSYNNDLIARAKAGDANAIGEYSAHYGYHFELKATDYYANGIVDEDHYIDTQYSWTQTKRNEPQTTFEILHSSIYDPGTWDWFLETTNTPTNSGSITVQRSVILNYDNKGTLVSNVSSQRKFETFEYGTLEQYESPVKYVYQTYDPSIFMQGVVDASINYNCGGCLTAPSLWDKYWNFVLSPGNGKEWYEFNKSPQHLTPSGVRR